MKILLTKINDVCPKQTIRGTFVDEFVSTSIKAQRLTKECKLCVCVHVCACMCVMVAEFAIVEALLR